MANDLQAAMDAANPSDPAVIARFVLTTNTGAVQLWQHDRVQWTREEALSEVEVIEFVERRRLHVQKAPVSTAHRST